MKIKLFLVLSALVIAGCDGNNNSSSTLSQTESNTISASNWEELGFEDIYEMGFKVEFSSKFNDEDILIEEERSEVYSPEQGNYIENSMDHYYYIYEDLFSKEHNKKEQKNINTFKIIADKDFTDIWLENVYKLNYIDNKLVKTNVGDVLYDKAQDSITLNLEKDEECAGYYFEVKFAYILKDIRGFMYYTGSMVLF